MSRIAILFCLILCFGCSGEFEPDAVDPGFDADAVEGGGIVENSARDTTEAYFVSLGKVRSAEEEEKVLLEFGEWLRKSGYKIRVEVKKGTHILSCPYFPPVTPWTDHSFLDVRNLELLPRLEGADNKHEQVTPPVASLKKDTVAFCNQAAFEDFVSAWLYWLTVLHPLQPVAMRGDRAAALKKQFLAVNLNQLRKSERAAQ